MFFFYFLGKTIIFYLRNQENIFMVRSIRQGPTVCANDKSNNKSSFLQYLPLVLASTAVKFSLHIVPCSHHLELLE